MLALGSANGTGMAARYQPFARRHDASCKYFGVRGNGRFKYLYDDACVLDGAGEWPPFTLLTGTAGLGATGEKVDVIALQENLNRFAFEVKFTPIPISGAIDNQTVRAFLAVTEWNFDRLFKAAANDSQRKAVDDARTDFKLRSSGPLAFDFVVDNVTPGSIAALGKLADDQHMPVVPRQASAGMAPSTKVALGVGAFVLLLGGVAIATSSSSDGGMSGARTHRRRRGFGASADIPLTFRRRHARNMRIASGVGRFVGGFATGALAGSLGSATGQYIGGHIRGLRGPVAFEFGTLEMILGIAVGSLAAYNGGEG